MMTEKRLTTQGITLPHLALIVLSLIVVGISIHQTSHFFTEYFPTTLGSSSSICDISSFWNCDSATRSPAAQLAMIPISIFSLIFGIYLLIHSVYATEASEKTGKFLATFNFLGCLALFIYSLTSLGSLCPVCTGYYFVSMLIFILFWKYSSLPAIPAPKHTAAWLVVLAVAAFFTRAEHIKKKERQDVVNAQIVQQFFKLKVGATPSSDKAKILIKVANAPIKISMFSDFQCPYCKLFAQDLEKAAKQFQGKVQADYFYYPLDAACNPSIKRAFHKSACKAAYVSYCAKDFVDAHDEIYAHQEELGSGFLDEYISKNNLKECVESDETKKAVISNIEYADSSFQVKATPTIIINGVRIKALPKSQIIALFQAILDKSK